ncbi:unnamed protein product, partial [Prorocentrum cordatum]
APPPPRAGAAAALVAEASPQHSASDSDVVLLEAGGARPARRRCWHRLPLAAAPLLLAAPVSLRWLAALVDGGPSGPTPARQWASESYIGRSEADSASEQGTPHGHKAPAKPSSPPFGIQFGPQKLAASTSDTAKSIDVADIDGDGLPDIVYAAQFDNMVYWFRNVGGGVFDVSVRNVTRSGEVNGPSSVKVVDLDKDSLPDVLVASMNDGKVSLYPGAGGGKFDDRQVITEDAWGASFANAADMNSDGALDVLSASRYDNKLAWYENGGGSNDSNGGWGDQMKITEDQKTAASVYAADVDGDGTLDVISAGPADSTVAWYKYEPKSKTWTKHVVGTVEGVYFVTTADVDGDGAVDLIACSPIEGKVLLWKNRGEGKDADRFDGPEVLTTDMAGAIHAYADDLDGDGDTDVLVAAMYSNRVSVFENLGNGDPQGAYHQLGGQRCIVRFRSRHQRRRRIRRSRCITG